MTISQMFLLFVSAVLGGTLNAVAIGGSFFTFPALMSTGVPAIQANATSTVALWPGIIASASAYRKDIPRQRSVLIGVLFGSSVLGGALGALLLLETSPSALVRVIPYLLLVATLLFAFSGRITRWTHRYKKSAWERHRSSKIEMISTTNSSIPSLIRTLTLQIIIATYGGYFGAGLGILTLAHLSMLEINDIHIMQALRTILNACINAVAILIFIVLGVVAWPQAIIMIVGAMIGGYAGAYYARKIARRWLRFFVITFGLSLTIYFFWHQR